MAAALPLAVQRHFHCHHANQGASPMGDQDTAPGYPPVPAHGSEGTAAGYPPAARRSGAAYGGDYPSVVRAPNAYRLLWAGFFAILAAGVGFAIRGGILANWGSEYGFTAEELGRIAGGGFTGFCFGIIIGGVIADKVGYGKLVISAFLLHIISAVVTFVPAYSTGMVKESVYVYLFWGSFLFAMANGNLEAVANPLV